MFSFPHRMRFCSFARDATGLRARKVAPCGFTLIEMLVVLSILAIGASLIMTATDGVRDRANRVGCTSNLHQLLLAVQMYESDSGHLPVQHPVLTFGSEGHWQQQVKPYVHNRSLFLCPSDPTSGAQYSFGGWPCSYAYLLSQLWYTPSGNYRPPAPDSPLFLDNFHLGKDGTMRTNAAILVARYNGSVEAAAPDKYSELTYKPADGLGMSIP